MTKYFDALEQLLSTNHASALYLDKISSGITISIRKKLDQSIQNVAIKYISLDAFKNICPETSDLQKTLENVMDVFPSFIFQLVTTWNKVPSYFDISRHLLIAGINTLISKNPDNTNHTLLFLEDIDSTAELSVLNAMLIKKEHETLYFPQLVFKDFVTIAPKSIQFKTSPNKFDLIETLFCFEGMSQVFLNYYFDLLCQADSDVIGEHIHMIFSKLFISLGKTENSYWPRFNNHDALLRQLHGVVEKDLPGVRHPVLNKGVFSNIFIYNIWFQNGITPSNEDQTVKKWREKLQLVFGFSIRKISLFLATLLIVKGQFHVEKLLELFSARAPRKLLRLFAFLRAHSTPIHKTLEAVVIPFIKNIDQTSVLVEDEPPILKQKIIPIGFENGAPLISVRDFFSFPFGENVDLLPEERYTQHQRYLKIAVEEEKLHPADLENISNNLINLPDLEYQKYFNIFPDNEFDDAVLTMVFTRWKNGGLDNLLKVGICSSNVQ